MMRREFINSSQIRDDIFKTQSTQSPSVLSVLGPTASGKTDFVINLLRSRPKLLNQNPLLVSIDAVTVYRGLNIGAAKVSGADRQDFDWIGLDILDPSEGITVRRFLDAVELPIAVAIEKGRPVILCGGSGFYERALVEGQAPGAESDLDFQKSLESFNNEALAKRLYSMGPEWKNKIHSNDRYRLTRYLDLTERQGFSYQDLFFTKLRHPRLRSLWTHTKTLFLGVDWPRETYSERLSLRIEKMFENGFLEEAQSLISVWSSSAPGLSSMGYREMMEYFDGHLSLEQTKTKILQSHLDYVKKQKTWFRGMQN